MGTQTSLHFKVQQVQYKCSFLADLKNN